MSLPNCHFLPPTQIVGNNAITRASFSIQVLKKQVSKTHENKFGNIYCLNGMNEQMKLHKKPRYTLKVSS